jgi:hypothetical protein
LPVLISAFRISLITVVFGFNPFNRLVKAVTAVLAVVSLAALILASSAAGVDGQAGTNDEPGALFIQSAVAADAYDHEDIDVEPVLIIASPEAYLVEFSHTYRTKHLQPSAEMFFVPEPPPPK